MPSRWYAAAVAILALATPARARAQIELLSPLRDEVETRPGSSHDGTIIVANVTDQPQTVRIHPADYRFFADGRTIFGPPGGARSNAGWISFAPSQLRIPPRGEARVAYTVRVPAAQTAPLAGTYWSVLMVESAAAPATAGERNELGLRITKRFAVQLVTSIAGTGVRNAEFSGVRVLRSPDGGRWLELDIEDTGDRSYRLDLSLELFDARGVSARKVRVLSPFLLPGTSTRQRFDLSAVPPGSYKALLLGDAGDDDIFGAEYRLSF